MSPLITTRAGASANAYGWGAASAVATSFESIATNSLSGATSYTFSSIPSTYKHLQIRFSMIVGAGNDAIYMRANGDTGSNYAGHGMWQTSATGYANNSQMYAYGSFYGANQTYPTVAIIDILDYASTTKYKTFRTYSGQNTNGTANTNINLNSGVWMSTTAISSILIRSGCTMNSGSIALYGIKESA